MSELTRYRYKVVNCIMLFGVLFSTLASFVGLPVAPVPTADAAPVAAPVAAPQAAATSVIVIGSFQSELGCANDWSETCTQTAMTQIVPGVWVYTPTIPAGNYTYKVFLNGSEYWPGGVNNDRVLNITQTTTVKFYFSDPTNTADRYLTENKNNRIFTVPGNFNSEIGCPDDWQPWCLRTWMTDPDGDGIFTFKTTAIPAGDYNFKVATNEDWANPNYPVNDIPFNVPAAGRLVTFSFNSATNVPSVQVGGGISGPDNNVEFVGLGHDSQNALYRQPFGAITPTTQVKLRFRTFANDVTGVRVRFFSTRGGGEFFQNMTKVAPNVGCYDAALTQFTCDWWETTYTPGDITTLYYRFIVTDGTKTAYYADDRFHDGGWGEATANLIDNSYVVTVYRPDFQPINWLKDAVIYQIFPDRFRDGDPSNNPTGNEPRYRYPNNQDDRIITKTWGALPEGYCQKYVNPATPCTENPRGRDYFGGDLKGVKDSLPYLQDLGVTVLYFNPVFDAGSNHLYDTQDYKKIDPFFGTEADWDALVADATTRGMKLMVDGVFNHVSSDSKYFDRYGHFPEVGACENVNSPYRNWFYFNPQAGGPCAGPNGPNTMTYDAWFGFDSLPVLNKNNQEVRDLVYAINNAGGADDSVARYWLRNGAASWRLDVMGDGSFPDIFWQQFRTAVQQTAQQLNFQSPIMGELWKKEEILPKILGDMADTTMNYRFRNAILGFFGRVDDKGFYDDGATDQPPSMFAKKILSTREDYPDAVFYTLMNIMGTHDTSRIVWWLTPGNRNREDKEFNAANLAIGKARMKLAVLAQMTMPGAPTIYYGDEVALHGDDDPDDRRSFPWDVSQATPTLGAGADADMRAHYKKLTGIRAANSEFRNATPKFLLLDDTNRTMAYAMRDGGKVSIVAINRSDVAKTINIPLDGFLRNGVNFTDLLNNANTATSAGGFLTLMLPALGGMLMQANNGQDITGPTAAPVLTATPGNAVVSLNWTNPGGDVVKFNVYRTLVSGGGYERIVTGTNATAYNDTTVTNGKRYYYVVRSVDALDNEGASSNEASASPSFPITYAVLQFPKDLTVTQGVTPTQLIYGQVFVGGVTDQAETKPELILAQVGYGAVGSNPSSWTTWVDATFNTKAGNNYEYQVRLIPQTVGAFDMLYRFSTDGGLTWTYGDKDGFFNGESGTDDPGKFTVNDNPDTTPPAAPLNLRVTDWSAGFVALAWDSVPDAAQYNVYRRLITGTYDYNMPVGTVYTTTTIFTDTTVSNGKTYGYVVRAVDYAYNESANSNEVTQTVAPKIVQVTFRVRVPAETPAADTVYLVGNIDFLGPWNPGLRPMTRTNTANVWEITVPILDGTQLQYKYTRGAWSRVESWGTLVGTENRSVGITYGSNGTQLVDNTDTDWSNPADRSKAVQKWSDPLVVSTIPANNATITSASVISITFSRDIFAATGNLSGTVVVSSTSGTISGTTSIYTPTDTLVFTPSSPLPNGSYTVTVRDIKSDVNDPMAQPYVFSFTVNGGPQPCANPYVVTINQDNGLCGSLTYAISQTLTANTAVTITFNLGANNVMTLPNTLSTSLVISGNVTLSGDGLGYNDACGTVPAVVINGNGANTDGVKLMGGAKLRNLHIKNFGGRELVLQSGGTESNKLKCVRVSNS
jgi:glycosidase